MTAVTGATTFAWTFWTLPWRRPASGKRSITSRAFDFEGNIQPPPDDPYLASRVTYWENNGQITRSVLIPYAPAPAPSGPKRPGG